MVTCRNMFRRTSIFIASVSLPLVIGACNTTERMTVPRVTASLPVSIKTPVASQASVAFGKVVVSIPRGTTIAHFPASGNRTAGTFCNYRHKGKSTLDWASGSREFGDWRSEFGDIFFNTLRDRGVNVVGDPQDLFRQNQAAQSAEYLIGARIKEIKGNFCQAHHWLDGRPLAEYSGEMWMSIEWSMFSGLQKRTVARFSTQGFHRQQQGKRQGISLAFLGAFASATENLLRERRFIETLERRSAPVQATTSALHTNSPTLVLDRLPLMTKSIRNARD